MKPTHLTKDDFQSGPPKGFYQQLEVIDFNRKLEQLVSEAIDKTVLQRYEIAGLTIESMPKYEFIPFKEAIKYVGMALRISQK